LDIYEGRALIKIVFLYLQSAESLSLIAGNLCIDEFGQKEFSQQGRLKDRTEETKTPQ